MKYQTIGKSNIDNASSVALGVMRINDLDDNKATEVIQTALESGINYFDSADIYASGKASRVFGKAWQDTGVNRSDIYIQSKGGILKETGQIDGDGRKGPAYSFEKDHLIAAAEIELERIGTDYLDLFLLHRPDTLMEPEEVAEAFKYLKDNGMVKHFGVSNFTPNQIKLLEKYLDEPILVNQLQFSLAHANMVDETVHMNISDDWRATETTYDFLTFARLNDITIQAWSPFQYGFFDGVFIDSPKFEKLNKVMENLAKKYGVTKNTIAVAWILRHPAKIQTIIGSMTPSRIKEMADVDNVNLTLNEWYDLYQAAGVILP